MQSTETQQQVTTVFLNSGKHVYTAKREGERVTISVDGVLQSVVSNVNAALDEMERLRRLEQEH